MHISLCLSHPHLPSYLFSFFLFLHIKKGSLSYLVVANSYSVFAGPETNGNLLSRLARLASWRNSFNFKATSGGTKAWSRPAGE